MSKTTRRARGDGGSPIRESPDEQLHFLDLPRPVATVLDLVARLRGRRRR